MRRCPTLEWIDLALLPEERPEPGPDYSDPRLYLADQPAPHPHERAVLRDGLCVSHSNPGWWTANQNQPAGRAEAYRAREVCRNCPVLFECREVSDYLDSHQKGGGLNPAYLAGVWGAEGPNQRAERRREAHATSTNDTAAA